MRSVHSGLVDGHRHAVRGATPSRRNAMSNGALWATNLVPSRRSASSGEHFAAPVARARTLRRWMPWSDVGPDTEEPPRTWRQQAAPTVEHDAVAVDHHHAHLQHVMAAQRQARRLHVDHGEPLGADRTRHAVHLRQGCDRHRCGSAERRHLAEERCPCRSSRATARSVRGGRGTARPPAAPATGRPRRTDRGARS